MTQVERVNKLQDGDMISDMLVCAQKLHGFTTQKATITAVET
jgi:hypothetical protein